MTSPFSQLDTALSTLRLTAPMFLASYLCGRDVTLAGVVDVLRRFEYTIRQDANQIEATSHSSRVVIAADNGAIKVTGDGFAVCWTPDHVDVSTTNRPLPAPI